MWEDVLKIPFRMFFLVRWNRLYGCTKNYTNMPLLQTRYQPGSKCRISIPISFFIWKHECRKWRWKNMLTQKKHGDNWQQPLPKTIGELQRQNMCPKNHGISKQVGTGDPRTLLYTSKPLYRRVQWLGCNISMWRFRCWLRVVPHVKQIVNKEVRLARQRQQAQMKGVKGVKARGVFFLRSLQCREWVNGTILVQSVHLFFHLQTKR